MKKVLSTRWLKAHKLTLPVDQLETLEAQAMGELEMRVGSYFIDRLTDEQVDEFEKIYNRAEEDTVSSENPALAWLEQNYPNYQQVVLREAGKMRCEILAARDKVALISSWKQT